MTLMAAILWWPGGMRNVEAEVLRLGPNAGSTEKLHTMRRDVCAAEDVAWGHVQNFFAVEVVAVLEAAALLGLPHQDQLRQRFRGKSRSQLRQPIQK